MSTATNNTTEDQAEVELRLKIIQEALAEAQAGGSKDFSNFSANKMQSLIDPQDDLACEGCQ